MHGQFNMHKIDVVVNVTLTLTYIDIHRLKALFQNPIGCTPEAELPEDKEIRCKMFNAMDDCTKVFPP